MKHPCLIVLLILLTLPSAAQPGKLRNKTLTFGIFDFRGGPITARDTAYTITLYTDYIERGKAKSIDAGIKLNSNKYYIRTTDGYPVTLTIKHGKETMVIRNLNKGIDSIAFLPGDYMVVFGWAPIFSVRLYGKTRLVNFDLGNMKSGEVILPPYVRFYGQECPPVPDDTVVNCYRYAQQIEAIHGGDGWVNNVYNGSYTADHLTKRQVLQSRLNRLMYTDQSRSKVRIYPLQKKAWLMHEYIMKDSTGHPNMHRLSISYNRGLSWHVIIAVPGEWNTRLVFFPRKAFIGIASSGYMLVSDDTYRNWTYYQLENPLPEHEEGLPGMMLQAEGWKKNMSGVLAFSRQPDAPGGREDSRMEIISDGARDSIYFSTRLAGDLLIPTMSCACGASDFYYRLYRQSSQGWTLARDHTEGPTTQQCKCLSLRARIRPGQRYGIPPAQQAGKYYLELTTRDGIRYVSPVFSVEP